jgi:5-methyltetrahydrofolate--homocysteine methyltransferase
MIIIGEKINGAIPAVAEAIKAKNREFIRELALRQAEAGAHYLDVCAGTEPGLERDTLAWLLDIVQSSVETPVCIDSPNPEALLQVLPRIRAPGIINSVSEEGDKCDRVYPFLSENPGWSVIALTCDNAGIPPDAETKAEIALRLIDRAAAHNIGPERLYIDPLVLSVSAVGDAMAQFIRAITLVKSRCPEAHFTSGLSNISYGMPARKYLNRSFLAFAIEAGMDSAIMDPTSKELYAALLAAEVLLGRDRHCRNYNRAYRAGRL